MEPTFELLEASMFAAIGHGTQLSASGFTVIFSPGHRWLDRADLSGIPSHAQKQIDVAGIPLTDEKGMAAYRAWRKEKDREKEMDGARYLITAPFTEAYSGGTGSAGRFNRVVLVDGAGGWRGHARVEQSEYYDAEAINAIRQKGAFVSHENERGIREALLALREANPAFAHVPFPESYA